MFFSGEDMITNVGTKLKLLNINAGAKHLLSSYKGNLEQMWYTSHILFYNILAYLIKMDSLLL